MILKNNLFNNVLYFQLLYISYWDASVRLITEKTSGFEFIFIPSTILYFGFFLHMWNFVVLCSDYLVINYIVLIKN